MKLDMNENKKYRMNEWLKILKREGYRLTGGRCVVIEVVSKTEKAINPSEIHELASKKYPTLGLVSVYRTLSILEDLGLVQRVHQHEECHAYVGAPMSHQHILICEQCGAVDYFTGDDLMDLIENVEHESGYRVRGHWLQLFGICKKCMSLSNDPAN